MKKVVLFIGVLLACLVGIGSSAMAQTYTVCNHSSVAVVVTLVYTCPPSSVWTGNVFVPPGSCVSRPVPASPCVLAGIRLNGSFYPVGYAGAANPPNPPDYVWVTGTVTSID